ncbi:MAG TPA: BTAD domain-containing putative transcriptional regulator [Pseudonocardia sp.]|nr:BTAD domain-containing putative transcriptional regulator [Pseudonocardia sp.]
MDGGGRLRVSLLGELAAWHGAEPLDLGGPRQRAVLGLLLLARGEAVRSDRLIELLWGEHPPANAVAVLQSYVSHLRRRLQPGSAARTRSAVIVRESPGYAIRLPVDAVDAWRFETLLQSARGAGEPAAAAALLTEGLALWRGPALADYADEPWAEAEIGRLTELRAVARELLVEARLELGEAALVVPELEAMVAEEPLREERWRLLALALYRAHRQADALGALRRARTTLADELGIDPGPALRDLEADVLAQSPALDRPRPAAAASPPAADPPPPPDLLDRDHELATVRTALDDLVAGEPGLLLIEGPAGIGKTRLLVEARRLAAARGVRVLTARGSQLEQSFGFGVARQLFEPELITDEHRAELFSGAAASARGVFDTVPAEVGDAEPVGGSFAVLHGLYWMAVNLTRSVPLLLAVDDVQWSDSASLRYLAYLVRRLEAVPVLVLGTVRTGEQQEDEALLAELALEPSAQVLRPAPLSAAATSGIVAGRLGPPASPLFTRACHAATAGNPLLLRQLLRALEADRVRPDAAHADVVVAVGSRAMSGMVLMRLRRLPPPVTVVARAAAVLGDSAPLPAVAALAEIPEATTATALAALARAEIIRDEQPVAFVHPLLREAVYRELPAAERELWHERAARVLRDHGAAGEQLGAHLLRAPRRADQETVAVLEAAARTAASRGASESAVTYLRRALDEPPTGERRRAVVLALGQREALMDGLAGARHLREAHALTTEQPARAHIAIAIARTEVFAGPPGAPTRFAREAADELVADFGAGDPTALPTELTDPHQALRALEWASGYMHQLDPATWRTAPAPEPTGDGPGARMLAATLAWETTLNGTDRSRAVSLARFALEHDRLWAVDNGLFWVVAAVVRMAADDDIGDFWNRARAEAHRRGSLFAALSVNVWQGYEHWRRGALDEALACIGAAIDQHRIWGGVGVGEPYSRVIEIGCHLDRGDLGAARQVADATLTTPFVGEGARLLQLEIARLLVAEGRPRDALDILDRVPMPVPIANPVRNPWRSVAAEARYRIGDRAGALELAAEDVELLRRWGAPSYLGPALRRHGQLLGPDGVELLREAVALLAPTGVAVELARARCALGSSPAVGDIEAVPLLEAASQDAHERGALGIRDRARAALRRRGRVVDTRCDHVRQPSSVERQILELAAADLTVPEIAQRLFLTPGTVRTVLDTSPEPASSSPQVGGRTVTDPAEGAW